MTKTGSRLVAGRAFAAAGLLLGAAVGAWAGGRARAYAAKEHPAGLIDWERARTIAVNMNRGYVLSAGDRARLNAYYRDLVRECIPVVSHYTGRTLPPTVERTFVFDRVDWINANLDAFRALFAPIEELHARKEGSGSVVSVLWGGLNRTVVSAEIGLLLGYLARRVLGQYDLALLGREPVTSGKLYYVEPNIRNVERLLGLPPEDFRKWLALHETTHAFEFEAHPWVRDHFNGLLGKYMEFLKEDVEKLTHGLTGLKIYAERLRNRRAGEESWIEALMTAEQRALFQRMQALMCVIEGFSNHVMNAVGRELLPTYDHIAKRFEARQRQRGVAEQLFARLTGLDLKLEQYRLGEAFVDRIVNERGRAALDHLWSGPDALPSMDEIRAPERWLARWDGKETKPTLAADAPAALGG